MPNSFKDELRLAADKTQAMPREEFMRLWKASEKRISLNPQTERDILNAKNGVENA